MSKRLPEPCAQWAEPLAQVSFGHLSGKASAALKAHLMTCPACAAVHAEYLQAAEILRQAPDPDPLPGLPPSLLQVWAAEARQAPARHLNGLRPLQEIPMQTLDHETPPAFPSKPPMWQRAGRRTVTVMSAIAAVLVIALVTTALIASHTPGKSSSTSSGQKATATAPATSTPTHPLNQQWQALPHLANISGADFTWLAPSDPRVVYQIVNSGQGATYLRRSDDQGATWTTLPSPVSGQESLPELYISPTNAQHVLALAQIECLSGQASVAGPLSILSDGNQCSVFYFSSNGGESWAPVTLPAHGSHNLFLLSIVAQEHRLYAIFVVNPGYIGTELVTSSDDGATWQFADQGLNAGQHCLQSLTAPATGTTLFATTLSHCGGGVSGSEAAQIWRSDDAGAHWSPKGTMSAIVASELTAVNVSGYSQPVLIISSQPGDPQAQQFSLDSGKTWQPAPTLGNQGTIPSPLGVLHDGSLLAQGDDGFYAWKPGDSSWHKVAPALAGTVLGALVVFDQASGKETLYLQTRSSGANTYSFYSVDLA
jgi:photosystem II stability/assembly factor-like uncharacterized protein